MKMFNKVVAPFSGTITEDLMSGREGVVVAKGERIFRIDPDERLEEESEQTPPAARGPARPAVPIRSPKRISAPASIWAIAASLARAGSNHAPMKPFRKVASAFTSLT